jgi:8-amino-7-oxononanoate synthase
VDALKAELEQLKAQDLFRTRRVVEGSLRPDMNVDGRRVVVFCSNDYLALASSSQLAYALQVGAQRWGAGSGASHLICGHTRNHCALEEDIAAYVQRPRALVFSSGYLANLGVISALLTRGDAVFEDRLNHASLIDGGLASGARFHRYRHGDVKTLQAHLARTSFRRGLVVTDGVFSMDGDVASLHELSAAAHARGAWLMVDDAHGIGVLGPEGRGSLAAQNVTMEQAPILVGTFGKALGAAGAFVAGSDTLIEYLMQKARTYIYTTAMPSAVAEAVRAGIRMAQRDDWRRERLFAAVARFQAGAAQLGIPLMPSATPIQPVVVGSNRRAVAVSNAMYEQGVWVPAIRPPTVPKGAARLRITFTAGHTEWHVDRLLHVLGEALRQYPDDE